MKLILLHGNNQELLLKKLSQIKSGFENIAILYPQDDLSSDFVSMSLFSDRRLVVLENPDIKIIEKLLLSNNYNLTVVVKFSKKLEKSSAVLRKVTEEKGEVLFFGEEVEPSIFPLLDMLGNLNNKAYAEFEKNYSKFGGQYIITMLAYFLRRMILNKFSSDFIRQKITAQKRNYNIKKIEVLYRRIIETDFKIKQGLLDEKTGLTLLITKILT